jgi:hypothetical protein
MNDTTYAEAIQLDLGIGDGIRLIWLNVLRFLGSFMRGNNGQELKKRKQVGIGLVRKHRAHADDPLVARQGVGKANHA